MWLDVPLAALDILKSRRLNIAAGIHAAEHAVLSLLPTFVISLPGDMRTECKVPEKEFLRKESSRKRPARLTFYDAKGGASGCGISTKAFEFVDELLAQACARLQSCYCLDGCNECCNDDACKQHNQVMSKAGAGVIIMCLLGREKDIDVEALPWGEEDFESGFDTVAVARPVRLAGGGVDVGVAAGAWDDQGERMVRAKFVDGVWIKEEEGDDDHFSRSVHFLSGERTFIGVHK